MYVFIDTYALSNIYIYIYIIYIYTYIYIKIIRKWMIIYLKVYYLHIKRKNGPNMLIQWIKSRLGVWMEE